MSYFAPVCRLRSVFLIKFLGDTSPFFGATDSSGFGLLVTSALGFKARVDPSLGCFLACVHWIPQIHIWCVTCWPLDGQHGNRALSIYILSFSNAYPVCQYLVSLNQKLIFLHSKTKCTNAQKDGNQNLAQDHMLRCTRRISYSPQSFFLSISQLEIPLYDLQHLFTLLLGEMREVEFPSHRRVRQLLEGRAVSATVSAGGRVVVARRFSVCKDRRFVGLLARV